MKAFTFTPLNSKLRKNCRQAMAEKKKKEKKPSSKI